MTGLMRIDPGAGVPTERVEPDQMHNAHYASLHAVGQALAASRDQEMPKVVLFDRDGVTAVYVSTLGMLGPAARADVSRAVRAALVPYTRLAPYTQVVFLTRGSAVTA